MTFREISYGWIVGIILHNDAIESHFVPLGDGSMHGDFWEMKVFARWRWNPSDGFDKSAFDCDVDVNMEQWDFAKRHLERVYGIPFDDEGYFNRKLFYEKMKSDPELED
jgi:hypothetical protein